MKPEFFHEDVVEDMNRLSELKDRNNNLLVLDFFEKQVEEFN